MSQEPQAKSLFGSGAEVVLKGTLEIVLPVINTVAEELWYGNYKYKIRQAPLMEGYPIWFNVLLIPDDRPIGVFTLQMLAGNRTLLRVPPSSQWSSVGLSGLELMKMGLAGSEYDQHFNYFIQRLKGELKRLGLKETWLQVSVRWIKTHRVVVSVMITVVFLVAAILTILEYLC